MRAAMYLRISLDRHGDGLAVDRQREDCEQLIQERGWTLTETYADQSISASDAATVRPAYQQMVSDWQSGRFDVIVCWDLDRLTRQPRQLEDWIDAAEKRGLRLVTANGEADLGTDSGRLYARVKAAVARSEVERKSARQKRAALQRAQQGRAWGPRRPFGFEDDGVEHRPAEAEAVRWMYEQFLTGTGQGEIARRLNGLGVRTSLGNEWSQATVRGLLLNPRNAGLRAYKGEVVGAAEWEPIVPAATYQAVVDTIERRRGAYYRRTRQHLLVGLAVCDVCEKTVRTGYAYYKGKRDRLYMCPDGAHVGRNAERTDALVVQTVLGIIGRNPSVLYKDDGRTAELSAQADVLRGRLDALAVEFADGALTASQLRAATERVRANLAGVEAELSASQGQAALAPLAGVEDVAAAWEGLGLEQQREVVRALMEVRIKRTARRGRGFDPEAVALIPR